jgi:hypothetical protein
LAQTTVLALAAGSVVMIAQFVVGMAGSRLVPHSEQGVNWDEWQNYVSIPDCWILGDWRRVPENAIVASVAAVEPANY